MKTKNVLKRLVAAAMLAAVTASFFGAPTSFACRVQPAATVTFLAVLLLTPLVGRLFCECFCPLGVIQSIVNWIFHPGSKVRRVCTRMPESKMQKIVRWTILSVFAVLISTGFGAMGWMLTPYSIYGKALTLFVPGVALFCVVAVLAAMGKGRFWCNWICPAGTLFALLSRKTLCAHKPGKGCDGCKACFGKPAASDNGEPRPAEAEREVSCATRRDTLKGVALFAAAEAVEKTTDGGFAPVSLPGMPARPAPVLPPGSVDSGEFDIKCVACGLCIANCRGNCLKPSLTIRRFGQPEMDFRSGYCLSGCAQQCAKVCPAGAIRPLEGVMRRNIHAGHAIWKRAICIRETQGVACTACYRKCPVKAISIVGGFPVVDKGACIGCGACEHVCPARPMPAIFVKGFKRQRIVRPFDEADLVAEMKMLVAKGEAACVIARDGVISGKASGRGIKPILQFLNEGRLTRAIVVDKVIGRAAAAICIVGKVKKVHAFMAGEDAIAMLKKHGIEVVAEKKVPKILNRDLTGVCPMEQTVGEIEDPAEMVSALKLRLSSMQ